MTNKLKGENIADIFLIFSQIAFFTAILINYLNTNLFPENIFIGVAGFLIAVSIISFIIKIRLKRR